MKLDEFDSIMERMNLAFETAKNLGQPMEQAKILFQMNEFLPESMQISFDEETEEVRADQVVALYKRKIRSKIYEFREQLMLN